MSLSFASKTAWDSVNVAMAPLGCSPLMLGPCVTPAFASPHNSLAAPHNSRPHILFSFDDSLTSHRPMPHLLSDARRSLRQSLAPDFILQDHPAPLDLAGLPGVRSNALGNNSLRHTPCITWPVYEGHLRHPIFDPPPASHRPTFCSLRRVFHLV